MKRLWKDVKEYKGRYSIGVILFLLCSLGGIISPFFMEKIIDEGILGKNINLLVFFSIATVILEVVCGICSFTYSYLLKTIHRQYCIKMDNKILDKILKFNKEKVDDDTIGKYMNVLSGSVDNIIGVFTNDILQLVCDITIAIVTFIILLYLNWKLLLISMAVQIFLIIINRKMGIKMQECIASLREKGDNMYQILEDILSNIRYIMQNGNSKFFVNKYNKMNIKYYDEEFRSNYISVTNSSLSSVLATISEVLIWLIGGFFVITSNITLGRLYMISSYSGRFLAPLIRILDANLHLKEFSLDLERVYEICDYEVEENEEYGMDIDNINKIEFKNVSFSYGNKEIFKDIDLKIIPNEINAIVGESGIGKTTLVNLILDKLPLDKGEILINEQNIKGISRTSLRRLVAYVSQDATIFNDSIINNILLGEDGSKEQIDVYARDLGIDKYIDSLDEQYETEMGVRGDLFSGGQCQKIAIIRALMKRSDVLIFDEPTSNLDNTSSKLFIDCINKEVKNKTIIIISHDLDNIKDCQNIFFISHGNMIKKGNHSSLMDSCKEYKTLYERK